MGTFSSNTDTLRTIRGSNIQAQEIPGIRSCECLQDHLDAAKLQTRGGLAPVQEEQEELTPSEHSAGSSRSRRSSHHSKQESVHAGAVAKSLFRRISNKLNRR